MLFLMPGHYLLMISLLTIPVICSWILFIRYTYSIISVALSSLVTFSLSTSFFTSEKRVVGLVLRYLQGGNEVYRKWADCNAKLCGGTLISLIYIVPTFRCNLFPLLQVKLNLERDNHLVEYLYRRIIQTMNLSQ